MAIHGPNNGLTHREWINDIMSDEQYNKEYQTVSIVNGIPMVYPDKYRQEYDQIAFDVMKDAGATITKLCVTLKITKVTLDRWVRRHPSFKVAVAVGGLEGEDAFRDQIKDAAFKPTSDVNNRLIAMIACNVYGIKADEHPTIVINNNNTPATLKEDESAALYAEAIDRKDECDIEIKAEYVENVDNQKLLS